jgi:hypothetical protein
VATVDEVVQEVTAAFGGCPPLTGRRRRLVPALSPITGCGDRDRATRVVRRVARTNGLTS